MVYLSKTWINRPNLIKIRVTQKKNLVETMEWDSSSSRDKLAKIRNYTETSYSIVDFDFVLWLFWSHWQAAFLVGWRSTVFYMPDCPINSLAHFAFTWRNAVASSGTHDAAAIRRSATGNWVLSRGASAGGAGGGSWERHSDNRRATVTRHTNLRLVICRKYLVC